MQRNLSLRFRFEGNKSIPHSHVQKSVGNPRDTRECRKTTKKTRLDELIDFFNRAPLKNSFEMSISYNELGNAVFDIPYNPNFDHTMVGIYGGVIASMIDNAGWYTAAAHTDNWVSTANLNIYLWNQQQRRIFEPSVGLSGPASAFR